jgi:hypothetical protein
MHNLQYKTNSKKHLYRFNLTNDCTLTKVIKSTIHIFQEVSLFSQNDEVIYIFLLWQSFTSYQAQKVK